MLAGQGDVAHRVVDVLEILAGGILGGGQAIQWVISVSDDPRLHHRRRGGGDVIRPRQGVRPAGAGGACLPESNGDSMNLPPCGVMLLSVSYLFTQCFCQQCTMRSSMALLIWGPCRLLETIPRIFPSYVILREPQQ